MKIKFFDVYTNENAPSLLCGDIVIAVQVSGYNGAGLYILEVDHQLEIYRAIMKDKKSIFLRHESVDYFDTTIDISKFEKIVKYKVAKRIHTIDNSIHGAERKIRDILTDNIKMNDENLMLSEKLNASLEQIKQLSNI